MRIEYVSLKNFGCIESAEVLFGEFSALIGPNNSGKSTILKAIEKFFSPAPRVDRSHFFRYEEDRVISITIRFASLTPAEREEFGNAVIDGKLTVTRQFGGDYGSSGIFSVDAMAFPRFQAFREETDGTKRRSLYAALRPEFDLPAASGTAMEDALASWEAAHVNELQSMRTRGFFGAPNVAVGKLRKKTSVRFIPAVVDVSSETDGPKSPVIELISDIRRQTLENRKDFIDLVSRANEDISRLVEDVERGAVERVSKEISRLVKHYYTDTEVAAELPPPQQLEVSFPPPALRVKHRAVQGSVDSVGHGLQRAILFSVVQFLAQHFAEGDGEDGSSSPGFTEPASDIVILVEEPEIYQHPQKQRIIRSVLERISNGYDERTGIRVQVACCTHSEKFVRIKNIDSVRIVRTEYADDSYKTTVSQTSVVALRDALFQARGAQGEPMPVETFAAGLHVFSEAVSEGFFADRVILVEGVADAAAVEGTYRSRERDPQAEGIAIIPVDGKTKMDKPLAAFSALGIKVYCVFDNDEAKKEKGGSKYNVLLQALCDEPDGQQFPVGCRNRFTSIRGDLESYLKQQTADRYDVLREKVAIGFSVGSSEMIKSPAMVSAFLVQARAVGHEFELFDQILAAVDAL